MMQHEFTCLELEVKNSLMEGPLEPQKHSPSIY